MEDKLEIRPQEGFQEVFLSSPADIAIGGGAAGAGKSHSLLLEPVRHKEVPGFGGVIFRRTTPQITNQGGLWDTSQEIYPYVGGTPRETKLSWGFPSGVKIKFSHLEYESNKLDWQGTEIPYIGFDELTHFTRTQFFYLVSRNRSMCGVRPYIRATCNPDPDSWVAEFIEWWIDQETGYPIPERAGVLRYFTKDRDMIVWGDTPEEVIAKCPHIFNLEEFAHLDKRDLIKSVTFIPGTVYGNKKLLAKNPEYLGNLLALDETEQLQLLKGNWKVRQDGSALFDYTRITDLFSNFVDKTEERYITCDYARFGQDLTVIMTWEGFEVVRIEILTTSSTVEAFEKIECERERVKIPRSNVLCDEDGVGGGVIDQSGGEYRGFVANAAALPNPEEMERNPKTAKKENYANLKTQCYYRFASRANSAQAAVRLDNVIVDGESTDRVQLKGKIYTVQKLISEDLRSVRKKDMDKDGKRQINGKDEQKNALGGRSPDCGDTLMMREWFELDKTPEPGVRLL